MTTLNVFSSQLSVINDAKLNNFNPDLGGGTRINNNLPAQLIAMADTNNGNGVAPIIGIPVIDKISKINESEFKEALQRIDIKLSPISVSTLLLLFQVIIKLLEQSAKTTAMMCECAEKQAKTNYQLKLNSGYISCAGNATGGLAMLGISLGGCWLTRKSIKYNETMINETKVAKGDNFSQLDLQQHDLFGKDRAVSARAACLQSNSFGLNSAVNGFFSIGTNVYEANANIGEKYAQSAASTLEQIIKSGEDNKAMVQSLVQNMIQIDTRANDATGNFRA